MLLHITLIVLIISNILLWIWIARLKLVIHYLIRDTNRSNKFIDGLESYLKSIRDEIENFKDDFKR